MLPVIVGGLIAIIGAAVGTLLSEYLQAHRWTREVERSRYEQLEAAAITLMSSVDALYSEALVYRLFSKRGQIDKEDLRRLCHTTDAIRAAVAHLQLGPQRLFLMAHELMMTATGWEQWAFRASYPDEDPDGEAIRAKVIVLKEIFTDIVRAELPLNRSRSTTTP